MRHVGVKISALSYPKQMNKVTKKRRKTDIDPKVDGCVFAIHNRSVIIIDSSLWRFFLFSSKFQCQIGLHELWLKRPDMKWYNAYRCERWRDAFGPVLFLDKNINASLKRKLDVM